jgi:uncharacterized membrane protein YbhN (UPF0104 family)
VGLLAVPDHHRGAGLGGVDSFIKLGLPVLALALVALQGAAGGGRLIAALAGIAEVGWAEVLAVFAFARLATAIPITPGGAGLVEVVLTEPRRR